VIRRLLVGGALIGSASCGYFNGMWSANHFAAEARHFERDGRFAEAKASWAQAAVKAESVVAHQPHSRWADDALVLQGEALAKSGACDRATSPLARALQSVQDSALLTRAALVAAGCALAAQDPASAERLLEPIATGSDRREASRAAYLLGQAGEQRGEFAAAAAWYARSREREAGPARARAHLRAVQTATGLAVVDTLIGEDFDEAVWDPLLAEVARAAGADTARGTLDHLLAHGHWRAGARARLLLADGDRLFAAGALDAADQRYAQVAAAVPDSTEGQQAAVRQVRVDVARASSPADLPPLQQRVNRLLQGGLGSAAGSDARALEALLRAITSPDGEASEALEFRTAEVARDSLRAPSVAAHLFLGFASAHPASLFAPKALVAAAALRPEASDSLLVVLRDRYPDSPYTVALDGNLSPGYSAAEDSLARALGLGVAILAAAAVPATGLPVPGPRGPRLDEPRADGRGATPTPAGPRRPLPGDDQAPRIKRRTPASLPAGAERP
jgi:hypothetical protein